MSGNAQGQACDYDVVVVGGGINGVGVAQAVAAAGHSVLLLEKNALAAGTSSKSSKLIHGGLRYLESFEFGLVREALHERALLLRLAPELVRMQSFCVPLYQDTRRSPWLLRAGLTLYYLLSGFDRNARFQVVSPAHWPSFAGLRTDGLRAVFRYPDAVTDDAALTRAVMCSAETLGAEWHGRANFVAAELADKCVRVDYRLPKAECTCTTRVLVNAGGPWVNNVLERVRPDQRQLGIELVQGTHVELPVTEKTPAALTAGDFFYVESPRDGRAVFVMPRGQRIVIGTTETRYRHDPDLVRPLPHEETYLLRVAGHYFPCFRELSRTDLAASWAGLRVLPGGEGHAFHRSRETHLHTDRRLRPRLISIYGGKLTSYRATAAKVMERIAPSLPERRPRARTDQLPLEPQAPGVS